MFMIFRWLCRVSDFFLRAENQYTSEDYGTMGLKRCKYRPLISSILGMLNGPAKIKYFEDIGFNNSLATIYIYMIYIYIHSLTFVQLGEHDSWIWRQTGGKLAYKQKFAEPRHIFGWIGSVFLRWSKGLEKYFCYFCCFTVPRFMDMFWYKGWSRASCSQVSNEN